MSIRDLLRTLIAFSLLGSINLLAEDERVPLPGVCMDKFGGFPAYADRGHRVKAVDQSNETYWVNIGFTSSGNAFYYWRDGQKEDTIRFDLKRNIISKRLVGEDGAWVGEKPLAPAGSKVGLDLLGDFLIIIAEDIARDESVAAYEGPFGRDPQWRPITDGLRMIYCAQTMARSFLERDF